MTRLLLIVLLLLPVRAFGMQMIGFGAGTCATQTVDQSYNTMSTGYTLYGSGTLGQSITAGDTGEVYSISIRGTGNTGGSGGQLIARIGTTQDLSASYLGQTTALDIIYDDVTRWYEMIFPAGSRPTITSTNTYYFTVVNTAADYDDSIYVQYHQDAGAYGGGIMHWGETTAHDMDYDYGASDVRFSVKVCD